MEKLNRIMKALFVAAGITAGATMFMKCTTSNAPMAVGLACLAFCGFYVFAWQKVLTMTVSPLKELRALIMRGVRSITIDYRRIPKCWHIVIEEELQESGYRVAHITGPVRIWEA